MAETAPHNVRASVSKFSSRLATESLAELVQQQRGTLRGANEALKSLKAQRADDVVGAACHTTPSIQVRIITLCRSQWLTFAMMCVADPDRVNHMPEDADNDDDPHLTRKTHQCYDISN